MSFLDNNGLSYFYGKLKEKFIRSVNSQTPDATGNVDITNVATADNLTSPDAQGSYDYFIYRTSGGSASLASGEAELVYIDGNMVAENRVQESFKATPSVGSNILVSYSISVWKNGALSDPASGTYWFSYTKPTSSTATANWAPDSGTWTYTPPSGSAVNNVNPANYGIYVSNIISPSLSVVAAGSGITGATAVPNTWFTANSNSGITVFNYMVPGPGDSFSEGWYLDETSVNLNTYGIATTGTATDGDSITVTAVIGTPNSNIKVEYTKYVPGTIVMAKPVTFEAVGFNHFNKASMYIADATISGGKIASNAGTYVCYCRATPASDSGWAAYSSGGYISNIGWCASQPASGTSVVTTGASVSSTMSTIPVEEDGYVVVVVSNMNDLMIHPRWSGAADDPTALGYSAYVAYTTPSVINIPTKDKNNVDLPTASGKWGMGAIGAVADRLNLEAGTYIQKIGRLANDKNSTHTNWDYVTGLGTAYDYDNSYIYYVLPDPISYEVTVDPVYTVNDWGTEEFTGTTVAVGAQTLYGQNLRDKLRTDVLTISEQNPALSTAQKERVLLNLGFVVANTWTDSNS